MIHGAKIHGANRRQKPPASLLRPPSARSAVAPFIVMDVMRAAAAKEANGAHIIHMEVGQPATPAPRAALEAVKRTLDTDPLGYTLALGMPALRERIAAHYKDWYGIDLSPERVVVTNGSSAAFVLAFLALFDVGARVALPSPGYPCYRHILTALGQRPVILETDAASRWMPTAQQIDVASEQSGLDGVLIASPANPTGTMLEPARLVEIVEVCRRRKLWLISDEIYHGLTYGLPAQTALRHAEDVVVVNSFSKYFSMTGWRIGWMIVPLGLVRVIERIAQNLYISPPTVSQVAATGAFDGIEELEANRRVYATNRALLLNELAKVGLDTIVPADGAFYLYVDVSRYTNDSLAFVTAMLEEIGVAVTPGVDFDETHGRHFIRLSYARSTPELVEAVHRLQSWSYLKRST
jgi:aspartate/methionine/tyrosine aminotransferase